MASNPFAPESLTFLNKIFSTVLQDVVVAVVILLIGLIIGRLVGKLVERGMIGLKINKILKKATGVRTSLAELIGTIVTYVIYFATIVVTLNQLKATLIVIYILSGIFIFVVIVALILGIKDFIPNLFAGIFLNQKGLLGVGDTIKFRDVEGRITEIGMIGTKIVTPQKDLYYIPNSVLAKSEVLKIKRGKKR